MKEKGKFYEAERRDFFRVGEDGNVESCRTVLEDMPEKLGYNVHKHNSYRHSVRTGCLCQEGTDREHCGRKEYQEGMLC